MNYVILNGINSNTISGLIIQELAPISKPQKKVKITEIEGKDGDIIDELGYEAYDKTIKIGLSRNYDIDQIIKYFNSSGKVTFSNENDKYYLYTITKKIDFERLVRFRTATVTFHVQPFKYKVDEELVDVSISNQTSITVENIGLEVSKPIITLYGSGIIELSINNSAVFQVNIDEDYLTIDSINEEAFKDTLSNLKNRKMSGDFPILNPGENVITWTGNLTRIIVDPKSRWL